MTTPAPLLLVDGSSYLYRAFHASERADLRTSEGFPTGAIRVVTNMIRSLINQYPDSPVAVIFDAKGKNFRHELFPEYKANRKPMPEDLRPQIEPIHAIIKAMGLPLLVVDGVEADDVMGTYAVEASTKQLPTIISTGDKDMAQLVTEHVTLIDTMKDEATDIERVKEKFGVAPEQIIDYLALVGDKVDNIPGVPKCGPKTAVKWLTEYQSMRGVIDNADKVKGKIGENLRASLEQLPLSYELATIKTDIELPQAIEELQMQPADQEALLELYKKYELRSFINEIDTEAADEPEKAQANYQIITDAAEFEAWLARLEEADLFAFDTETTSLDSRLAEIVGVSFAIEAGEAAYVPVAHTAPGTPEQLDRDWVLTRLKPLLESDAHKIVGQNLKYDRSVLTNYAIELNGIGADTMLASYVLNSTASRHDMDSLAKHYLNLSTIKYEEVAGKGAKQLTFDQVPLEQAGPYAAEDADITLRLHQALAPQLQQEPSLQKVLDEIELPLLPVIDRIERNGTLVDRQQLQQQSQELAVRMEQIQKEAYVEAGEEFNLGSPKQLASILFDDDKKALPIIKKTPKGAPSTAEEVLVELALDYPLPKLILEYRSLSKLKSTYTDKLPLMINPNSGRIHTSYHQAVAATGRLSSSDPNLQNIPIRTAEGRRIRQAFIAAPGYQLIAADYSQIELRIMAHLSRDQGLLDAFAQGLDIHRATAAEVFATDLEQVTDNQRRSAKAINFGLIYGMSAFGLAKQLHLGRNEAQNYINLYFERYPGVQQYMDDIRAKAHEQGYVETLFGRRLYLPEINARNKQRQQAAERTAINAPMQGSAADIIKRAMLDVDHWLNSADVDAKIIMQVHDELVLEVKDEYVEEVAKQLKQRMEAAATLDVPLIVDVGRGINWDQAH